VVSKREGFLAMGQQQLRREKDLIGNMPVNML
jgi:hypothetical protein